MHAMKRVTCCGFISHPPSGREPMENVCEGEAKLGTDLGLAMYSRYNSRLLNGVRGKISYCMCHCPLWSCLKAEMPPIFETIMNRNNTTTSAASIVIP